VRALESLRRIRGLSPVIAVLLLILIAATGSVALYGWFSGAASQNPANTPELYERLKVEGVSVEVSGSKYNIDIYVRNTGQTVATIGSAYIVDARSGTVIAAKTGLSEQLSPGDSTTINIKVNKSSMEEGSTYIVKVVTVNGIEAEFTFTLMTSN